MEIIIVVALFVLPVVLWKKLYFKPVTCAWVCKESVLIEAFRPSRKEFKKRFLNYNCCKCGDRFIVFYNNGDQIDSYSIVYDDNIRFSRPCYIFSVGFLGRLKSVDVSSRSFQNVISKFVCEV